MAQKGFMALIIPMRSDVYPDQGLPGPGSAGGEHPDNTLPGSQPRPDNTLPGDLPHPEHPIYWPLPPDAPVDPDYGIPVIPGMEGGAPRPDQGLPGSQPHPDQGLPGSQPRPDHGLPPFPDHPIALPPGTGGWLPVYIDNSLPGPGSAGGEHPDNTLPGSQPHPDQGLPPFPAHPIFLPPDTEVPPAWGIQGTIKFKAIWTPDNGWQTIAVIIPGGSGVGMPIPTPSTGSAGKGKTKS